MGGWVVGVLKCCSDVFVHIKFETQDDELIKTSKVVKSAGFVEMHV